MYKLLRFVETFFLIHCLEDEGLLYDVVNAKFIVTPEGTDVLDVKPGIICRAQYHSEFYKAQVLEVGEHQAI